MNARLLAPCLLLTAACTGGSAPAPGASPSTAPASTVAAAPSPSGPSVAADIVTIDTAAPSITLREGDVPPLASPRPSDLKKGDRTIRVEPSAAASLAGLKPGDHVRVTCSAMQATMMPAASPAAGAGAASPAAGAMSGAMSGGTAAMGATSGLAQCDSVVAITAAGTGAP